MATRIPARKQKSSGEVQWQFYDNPGPFYAVHSKITRVALYPQGVWRELNENCFPQRACEVGGWWERAGLDSGHGCSPLRQDSLTDQPGSAVPQGPRLDDLGRSIPLISHHSLSWANRGEGCSSMKGPVAGPPKTPRFRRWRYQRGSEAGRLSSCEVSDTRRCRARMGPHVW